MKTRSAIARGALLAYVILGAACASLSAPSSPGPWVVAFSMRTSPSLISPAAHADSPAATV